MFLATTTALPGVLLAQSTEPAPATTPAGAIPSAKKAPAAKAAKSSAAVGELPKDYRSQIARQLRASYKGRAIERAEISIPGKAWAGLIEGGVRTMVCARVTVRGQGIFGTTTATSTTGYLFDKGRIAGSFGVGGFNPATGFVGAALQDSLSCGQLTYVPFRELKQ